MADMKDHVVVVGFNGEAVTTGIAEIERKLGAIQGKIQKAENLASGGTGKGGGGRGGRSPADRASRERDLEYARQVRAARKQVRERRKAHLDEVKAAKKAEDDKLALINAQIKTARAAEEKLKKEKEQAGKERDKEYAKEVRLAKKRVKALEKERVEQEKVIKRQADAELALLNARIRTKNKKEAKARKDAERQARHDNTFYAKQQAFLATLDRQKDRLSGPLNTLGEHLKNGVGGKRRKAAGTVHGELAAKVKQLEEIKERVAAGGYSAKGYADLRKEFSDLVSKSKDVTKNVTALNRQLSQGSFFARAMSDSFGHFARSMASFYMAQAGALSLYDKGKQMDSMQASLLAASGSSQQAAKDFEWLRQQADRLGRSLTDGTKGFTGIAVAARGAGYSAEEAKEVYLAAQEAATSMAMSNEDAKLVMFALQQMMSKTVVSSEEMQRQLGERAPMAWEAASKATGKTREELTKLIQAGKIMSKDFVLPMAKEMRKIAKHGGSLQAGMEKVISAENRMGNAWTLFAKNIMDAGLGEALKDIFDGISELLVGITPVFEGFSKVVMAAVWIVKKFVEILDVIVGVIGLDISNVVGVFALLLVGTLIPALLAARKATEAAALANLGWAASFLVILKHVKVLDWFLLGMVRRHPWIFGLAALSAAVGYYFTDKGTASTSPASGGSSTNVVHDNRRIEVSVNGSGVSDSSQLADMIVEKVKRQMGTGGVYA